MPEILEVCELAARAGGAALRDWAGRFTVSEKGPADLVTEADLAAQEAVREVIGKAFPRHGLLGEEGDELTAADGENRWIVDPLDGTTNYVHGYPQYAVSVALERNGAILAGTVYDPLADECFTASAGNGAWLNGRRLTVGRVERLADALVAASFPPRPTADSPAMVQFVAVSAVAQSVRRTGSAALNLSYVAAGRFDAYWALDNKPWDVAAGILLVREAGGYVVGLESDEVPLATPRLVAAANSTLGEELRRLVVGRCVG